MLVNRLALEKIAFSIALNIHQKNDNYVMVTAWLGRRFLNMLYVNALKLFFNLKKNLIAPFFLPVKASPSS